MATETDALWWLALVLFVVLIAPCVAVLFLVRAGARCGSDLVGSVLQTLHF